MNTSISDKLDFEDQFQVKAYKRLPLTVASGKGSWITTETGARFLDLYGGHAVAITGHCHPHVISAIKTQADTLLFYSNIVSLHVRADAAEKLVKLCPPGLSKVFFVNSGAEANENAIKLARTVTGRPGIISFTGAFHGRTLGTLNAAGIDKYRQSAGMLVPNYHIVPWNDSGAVARLLSSKDIAGVILEPIQSLAGVRTPSPQFLIELRRLCDLHGALLIYDELQTGMGRTGTFLYASRHGVTPDLVTLGKGMASGIPLAAVLTSERVAATVAQGDLGTTFGGGPLAAAALAATLEVLESEGLMENARSQGEYLRNQLQEFACVSAVEGEGLLIGVRFKKGAKRYLDALLERHIMTGTSDDPEVLRLLPPLNITAAEINLFLKALADIESSWH